MLQPTLVEYFSKASAELSAVSDDYVPRLVDLLLNCGREQGASDIHLTPAEQQMRMQWRVDGVLHTVAAFDSELSVRIVARLKVLSGLLTYRTDIPQEGRISAVTEERASEGEVRVTTFPTLFGEKAAVRLFADSNQYQLLQDLGLPNDIETTMRGLLQQTSGVILLTGPSGSGKTTTVYGCLRELTRLLGESKGLMTLEDPIEVVVPGVTQSQVRPNVGFDLATGLKSMMRQDPDVIMIGEIRDPETAECAFQAALTGHLVITTFHAGSSVEAVARLLEMGIEPYLLRSTLQAVVCQRLLRRMCSRCGANRGQGADSDNVVKSVRLQDNPSEEDNQAHGCPVCGGVGHKGRFVTAELLDPNCFGVSRAIMNHSDARTLQSIAEDDGMTTLRMRALQAVESGQTTPEEVFRVLGNHQA